MMITGDKKLDNIMEIAEAVFACPEAGKYNKAVEEAKYEAIQKTLKTTQYYREHGFMSDLVHTIFSKKMVMIKNANTVKDLKEIEKGSLPHFNGNSFMTGPYHIPEEEMILWSLTSLKGPLIPQGLKRYMDLFKQVFGVDPNTCTDEDLRRIHLEEAS